ncbi:FRG domain-containing protein [Bibersteinia trehalosi]|uniref:FRG domain-containing protein n=1 Tax=Bibersteinia trehalosi TaxID=47735 RepID=A0A426FHU5_BIBTR|nr:FRG domain-containing protein [Bibersteinia trehalosi]RRN03839.1 FRG domain-containing protein [Bibersteinia trehalosi]
MNNVININEIKQIDIQKKSLWEQQFCYEQYAENKTLGVIRCIKIDTVEQLDYLLGQLNAIPTTRKPIYRGQSNVHWKLLSTLEREIAKQKIQMDREQITDKIYDAIIDSKNLGFAFLEKNLENKLTVFNIGQNFGLNTPLLSFSRSFDIALFFAFQESCYDGYRAVYRLFEDLIIHLEDSDKILSPEIDFWGRIECQKTIFSWWGLEETLQKFINEIETIYSNNPERQEEFKSMVATKFYISDKLSDYIMGYLKGKNIDKNTLFPDFYTSISQKINSMKFEEQCEKVKNKHDSSTKALSFKRTKPMPKIDPNWGIYGNGNIKAFFGMYYGQDNRSIATICDLDVVKAVNLIGMSEFNIIKQSSKIYTEWFNEKIDNADFFIVALRKGSQNLHWLKYEIREAWNAGVPVLGIQIERLMKSQHKNQFSPFHRYEYVDQRFGEFSPPILSVPKEIKEQTEVLEYIKNHLKEMLYWAENYRRDKPNITERMGFNINWLGL